MKASEYRDMYYAITNGVEIGVSAESVLEEVVAERKSNNLTSSEYNDLIAFFKDCDQKNGAHNVICNFSVQVQNEQNITDMNNITHSSFAGNCRKLMSLPQLNQSKQCTVRKES